MSRPRSCCSGISRSRSSADRALRARAIALRAASCRNAASSSNVSVTGSARARAASSAARHRLHAREILFGRHQDQALAVGSLAQRLRLAARVAMMVGEAPGRGDRDAGRRAAWRRISPDRRCRRRRARGLPPSAAMNAGIRREPRAEDRQRRAARFVRDVGCAAAVADHDQRLRAIELRAERRAQRPGRDHAAVADAAPRIDHEDGEILGQRRVLEAVVHDDDARAGRDRRLRALARGRAPRWSAPRAPAAAARRRHRRRGAAPDRPAPARRAGRHSRGSGTPAARRRPAACARPPARSASCRRRRRSDCRCRPPARRRARPPAPSGARRPRRRAPPAAPAAPPQRPACRHQNGGSRMAVAALEPDLHQIGIERGDACARARRRAAATVSRAAPRIAARSPASLSSAPTRTVSLPTSAISSAPCAASSAS